MMSSYLDVAKLAAEEAGEILRNQFGINHSSRIKADGTPVSKIDLLIEHKLIKVISSYYPSHSFLSEEGGWKENSPDYLWIIDPIDGTKNFLRGIPLFGVQVSLMNRSQFILGISFMPIFGEFMCAEYMGGAYLNEKKIFVSDIYALGESQISIGGLNRLYRGGYLEGIVNICSRVDRVRGFGDIYPYHLLASARLDCVLENEVKIWDIAAASIIVKEAGGRITDFGGNDINIDSTSCVASNGLIHDEVLDLLRK